MSTGQTPPKVAAQTAMPTNSNLPVVKEKFIQIQAEELKPRRTVQGFLDICEKQDVLRDKYSRFKSRVKELNDFKDLQADGSACRLFVVHSSNKQIEFHNQKTITEFVNEMHLQGMDEVLRLENDIIGFRD